MARAASKYRSVQAIARFPDFAKESILPAYYHTTVYTADSTASAYTASAGSSHNGIALPTLFRPPHWHSPRLSR